MLHADRSLIKTLSSSITILDLSSTIFNYGNLCTGTLFLIFLIWSARNMTNSDGQVFIYFLILGVVLWEGVSSLGGMPSYRKEVVRRLRRLRTLIKHGIYYQELKEPLSTAVNLVRTLRDQRWFLVPINLLVAGDIIQSPLNHSNPLLSVEKVAAEQDLYKVCEPSPLARQLDILEEGVINHKEPDMAFKAYFTLFIVILWVFFALGSLTVRSQTIAVITIAYFTMKLPESALFTLFLNTRIYRLIDFLKRSRTPYIEAETDEFDDEAPPPSQDIQIPILTVLLSMVTVLFEDASDSIFWSIDLSLLISSTSVMAFLDKEGLIFGPFPKPLEIIVPDPNDALGIIHEEIDGNPLNFDRDFYRCLSNRDVMKGLGFCNLVWSHFGTFQGTFPKETHGRFPINSLVSQRLDPIFWTCTCGIARRLGFHATADWYIRSIGTPVVTVDEDGPAEFQGILWNVFKEMPYEKHHCLAISGLKASTSMIAFKWDSQKLLPITPAFKRKLLDYQASLLATDRRCISFTYRPIMENELVAKILEGKATSEVFDKFQPLCQSDTSLGQIIRDHIFLGALVLGYEPKENMQDLISDLENCGIRFVYFSPHSIAVTEAIGKKLGLETDWNSCIILSDSDPSGLDTNPQRYTDPKSKLPRGVKNIRPHLKNVDDVPLHISLFSECDREAISEMVKIYRENNETVMVVGSGLNPKNISAFVAGDIAIFMEPSYTNKPLPNSLPSSLFISTGLTSLTCALSLPFDCSPYVFTEIIREGRGLQRVRDALRDLLTCSTIVILLIVIRGTTVNISTLGMLLVCMAGSVAFYLSAPIDADVLKQMPNITRKVPGRTILFGLRFIANSILFGLFLPSISSLVQGLLASLLYMAISVNFFHETLSVFNYSNHGVKFISTFMLFFVSIMSWLLLKTRSSKEILLINLWKVFLGICLIFGINEIVKWFYRKRHSDACKRAKLEFNTKLGMHSPI